MVTFSVGRLAVWLAVGVLAVAACGTSSGGPATSSPSPSGASPSTVSSAPQSPSTSTAPTSSASSTGAALADGRYAARITAADAGHRLLTVDVVQFFTGKAAASAAAADHAPEVPPPNDYWIRNSSPALRTLYVSTTAPITVNVLGAAITGSATQNLQVSLSKLAGFPGLGDGLFWLTSEHQVITSIAEQYLP